MGNRQPGKVGSQRGTAQGFSGPQHEKSGGRQPWLQDARAARASGLASCLCALVLRRRLLLRVLRRLDAPATAHAQQAAAAAPPKMDDIWYRAGLRRHAEARHALHHVVRSVLFLHAGWRRRSSSRAFAGGCVGCHGLLPVASFAVLWQRPDLGLAPSAVEQSREA